MASRIKQKEEARARRLADEQARSEQVRRNRRLQMLGGVVVVAVAVVAVAIAVSSGGGSTRPIAHPSAKGVKLPKPKITNLAAAVKAAGCVMSIADPAVAGSQQNRTHVAPGTQVQYVTNPPSYGPHYPSPASDGVYAPGHVPAVGYIVHAMEHGRVEFQYKPGLPQKDVEQLNALFNEREGQWSPGQLLLLFPNQTGMPYQVAATAWGRVLGCKTFSPQVFDALRDFRLAYTNQGPENLGTGPE
jgi:hypothetical protein